MTWMTFGSSSSRPRSNAADIRCDNAVPGRTTAGCVLPFAQQELQWPLSAYPTYGAHLIAADASGLPGSRDSGVPLHRLIDQSLQNQNRNTSSSAGATLNSVLYSPYRYLDGDGFWVGIS
jgi:hypothetical protein